ncbi:pantoate--beta-alanine ligase [Bacteroidales bacterium OttesenSCG-928-I14]|nr:pantoate--beta-alanine ligase [Bacteroidales bacterium OttesenSCG-928-I14]
MKIIGTVSELKKELSGLTNIGFVPTMGALHNGHLALVKKAISENKLTVVSIFVNPTQFNDPKDLEKYPRPLEADCRLLEDAGTDIVFAPSVSEMYPEPDNRVFDFGNLSNVMEGQFRPGHFNGVGQIVSRLFDIVRPKRAYFGEKDFQQLAIVRELNRQLGFDIEIIGCPIVREADGLAMSSRNARLNTELRKAAPAIYKALSESKAAQKTSSVNETINSVIEKINKEEGLEVEYFEIVDGNTLQTIKEWEETNYPVGCIAVFAGETRLIDNITYDKY